MLLSSLASTIASPLGFVITTRWLSSSSITSVTFSIGMAFVQQPRSGLWLSNMVI